MTPMIDNASATEPRLPEFSLMPVETTIVGGGASLFANDPYRASSGGGDNSLSP